MSKEAKEVQTQKVYFVEDIQKFMCLGRSKTYEFLQQVYEDKGPFRVIKVGKLFRIPKQSFNNWIDSE